MVRETTLSVSDLVYPLFVVHGKGIKKEIPSMPGNYHLSVDCLVIELKAAVYLVTGDPFLPGPSCYLTGEEIA